MIRNLTLVRLVNHPPLILGELVDRMDSSRFVPCAPSQQQSMGWVPPRGEGEAMAEEVAGFIVARFRIESKPVPASAIRRKVDEMAAKVEQDTGRKPGRKQRKDMASDALHQLLPHAFERTLDTVVLIDATTGLVYIGSASSKVTDQVTTALVHITGAGMKAVQTNANPTTAMTAWLATGEPPPGLTLGTDCELKSPDEMRAVVRYGRHNLDIAEVRSHIQAGKEPTRLGLEWNGRVSFVLTDRLTLRRIDFDDVEVNGQRRGESFDGDVAIVGNELRCLVDSLLDALGGEVKPE